MQKLRLILLTLLLLPAAAFAQTREDGDVAQGFFAGLSTGLNAGRILVDDGDRPNNKHFDPELWWRWAPAGVALGYKFNTHHSVQVEGIFSRQGSKFDLLDDNGRVVGEKEMDLRYWAVPVLFKFTNNAPTRFSVQLGGQLAFLTKGREVNTFYETVTATRYDGSTRTYPQGTYLLASTEDEDKKRNPGIGGFNYFDPSVTFGIGLERDITDKLYFLINFRVNYAFKEIRDTETVEDALDMDKYFLRNNITGTAQFGLHYFISNK